MSSKQALLDFLAPTFDLRCAVEYICSHCSLCSIHFICWELLLVGDFLVGLVFWLSKVFQFFGGFGGVCFCFHLVVWFLCCLFGFGAFLVLVHVVGTCLVFFL